MFVRCACPYRNDKSRLISLPISIQYCNSVCLKSGQGNSADTVKSDAKRCLASALLEQMKISCYTEYKAFTNLQYPMINSFFDLQDIIFNIASDRKQGQKNI